MSLDLLKFPPTGARATSSTGARGFVVRKRILMTGREHCEGGGSFERQDVSARLSGWRAANEVDAPRPDHGWPPEAACLKDRAIRGDQDGRGSIAPGSRQ
jgi:hypothetical protein